MAEEKTILLDCECCGGKLNKVSETQYRCDYCGNEKFIETILSSEVIMLLNQANALKNKGDFDGAYDVFCEIIRKDPDNVDAHMGLFYCDYGVMHVEDVESKEFIPTCNKINNKIVFENKHYLKASSLANGRIRAELKKKVNEIEEIRKKVIEIANLEKPTDIVICYKRTDGENGITKDTLVARDIYEILTEKGYNVFLAEKNLQFMAGFEFEPVIYNAIRTSKVMLVISSNLDNIMSGWTKNEWTRFIKFMEFDRAKKLIPIICEGFNASELPDSLRKFEALEINANFKNSLLSSIEKCVQVSTSKINRVKIGAQKETKKEKAFKQNVVVRKLTENKKTDLVVVDEKIVKIILTYINKGMYKEAIKELKFLSGDSEQKIVKNFVNNYVCFKTKNEFTHLIESVNDYLEYASPEIAGIIFDMLEEDFESLLRKENVTDASELYRLLLSWENDKHERAFKTMNSYILKSEKFETSLIRTVVNCFDINLHDFEDVITKYFTVATDKLNFVGANLILDYLLAFDEGDIDARWNRFLVSFGATNERIIKYVAHNLNVKKLQSFKDFLEYVPEEDRANYIKMLCNGIIDAIKFTNNSVRLRADIGDGFLTNYVRLLTNNFELNVIKKKNLIGYNSNYFYRVSNGEDRFYYPHKDFLKTLKAIQRNDKFKLRRVNPLEKIDLKVYLKSFNEIIRYFSNDDNAVLIETLLKMADKCKEISEFKTAKYYYNLVLSENGLCHKAHWGLFQCKLKCKSEEELKKYSEKFFKYKEFNHAVISAEMTNDEVAVEKYLNLQNYAKHNKTNNRIFYK